MIMGHTVVRMPSLSSVSARLHLVGFDLWWCAACGGQHDWRNPNRVQHGPPKCQNVSGTRSVAWCVCENVMNALTLLANQQTGGDSPAEVLVEGLQGRSRLKMMEELRRFITVDNHEAKTIGDLARTLV